MPRAPIVALTTAVPEWVPVTDDMLSDSTLPLVGPNAILSAFSYDSGTAEYTATFVGSIPAQSDGVREAERAMFALPTGYDPAGGEAIVFRLTIVSAPLANTASSIFVGVIDRDGTDNTNSQGCGGGIADGSAIQKRILAVTDTLPATSANYSGTIDSVVVTYVPVGSTDGGTGTRIGVVTVNAYDSTTPGTPSTRTAIQGATVEGNLLCFLGFGFDAGTGGGGTWVFKLDYRRATLIPDFDELG